MNKQQIDVIMSLTEDFLWVRDAEYIKYFSNAFDNFIKSLKSTPNIIILPLLPEEDFGKSKSSIFLFYNVKCRLAHIRAKYSEFNIVAIDTPQNFRKDLISSNSVFCIIDDFIGSGNTANAAANYMVNNGVDKHNLVILSLVAMEQGINYLKEKGYSVFSAEIKQKAITGRYDNSDSVKDIMIGIEDMIKVESDFKFGYAHSEALVRMERTPNNTFPIYWLKNKNNPHAPFPR